MRSVGTRCLEVELFTEVVDGLLGHGSLRSVEGVIGYHTHSVHGASFKNYYVGFDVNGFAHIASNMGAILVEFAHDLG